MDVILHTSSYIHLTAMSMIASSSRAVLSSTGTSAGRRTVVHHARPPRQPLLRAPQTPRAPLPTSGTSHPNPDAASTSVASSSSTQVRSTQISGTNFTLYHAPPPSAPSYTNGAMPPFLQWVRGTEVSLTGEEQAPLRKARKREIEGGLGWDEEMLNKMREMRANGKTRSQVGDAYVPATCQILVYTICVLCSYTDQLCSLSIPAEFRHLIARAAPSTPEQRKTKEQQLEDQKLTWGYKKRLSREVRQKRRQFW